jgi:HSP20 family protein
MNTMTRSAFIATRDPLAHLLRLQNELEQSVRRPFRWFASSSIGRGVFPPVNIFKRSDGCVVLAEVPGLAAEDLSIESQGQSLTISGKRGPEAALGTTHRNERWSGEFSRSLELPRELNPSKAEADYKDGVLRIRVPLREEAKPEQIAVRAS